MTPRPATAAEVAACHRATFRPYPVAGMTRGPAGEVPRVVVPDIGGDLLADLEGLPLGGPVRAWGGGLYRVGAWDHAARVRYEQVQAVVAVEHPEPAHRPIGRRLSWLVAVVDLETQP